MAENYAKDCRSTIIPAMRYRDAHKAIEWLIAALGFEKKVVYEGEEGIVEHAELTFGNGMIMLGTVRETNWSKLVAQPDEIDGRTTVTTCLLTSDATALHAMAQAAGAEIVLPLGDMPYGGKAFSCRDPEGHLWSIGEYDPWA